MKICISLISCKQSDADLRFSIVLIMNNSGIWVIMPCGLLLSCLAYSSTLQMELTYSSEKSVVFQWTTWHHIAENGTLESFAVCEDEVMCIIPYWHYYHMLSDI
jgi:hypothetical protein